MINKENISKEKAKELVEKYYNLIPVNGFKGTYGTFKKHAKQCALICVDEILKELEELHHKTPLFFWQEVKQELNNL